jgi:hypothetical protein
MVLASSADLPRDLSQLSVDDAPPADGDQLSLDDQLTPDDRPAKSPKLFGLPPNRDIVLDEDGDLVLEVGVSRQRFLVDSHSLARASPAFKTKLFGESGSRRSSRRASGVASPPSGSSGSEWVVQLPDDEVAAMTVLLRLLHGQAVVAPPGLGGFDDIFGLVGSARRYELVHLLRPWTERLVGAVERDVAARPGTLATGEAFEAMRRRLEVAWDLGAEKLFGLVARRLLLNVESSGDGDLADPVGDALEFDTLPAIKSSGILGMHTYFFLPASPA